MRKGVWTAAGLALLAALSFGAWGSAPASAMAISAPAALKAAGEGIRLDQPVHCWDDCYYGPPRYYRPYYRPAYRSYYYDDGPRYYRPYYRPAYRSYYYGPPAYRSEPWWTSGPYYAPRPRYYFGSRVYWY